MQQENEELQKARRRLYADVEEQKERLAQQESRNRAELDRLKRQLEDQTNHSTDAMRKEYEKARDEQERRHEVCRHFAIISLMRYKICSMFCRYQTEIRHLKEQLAVEKTAFEENYMKKQEAWCLQKVRCSNSHDFQLDGTSHVTDDSNSFVSGARIEGTGAQGTRQGDRTRHPQSGGTQSK